jgi:hypothetical protein
MIAIKHDFERRVTEIELYFKHLELFSERDAFIKTPTSTYKKRVDPELLKVMKANCFLLLYNLVESSISQSLTHIFDTISAKRKMYCEVKPQIRKIWIKHKHNNFKEKNSDSIFNILQTIENDILDIQGFEGIPISGNIDGQKIKSIAELLGFSYKVHYTAGRGENLHVVKVRRNKLAHGEESFSECGRSFTYADLVTIKNQVIRYVRRILNNIESFLDEDQYVINP